MPRVRRGPKRAQKRKRLLKQAKGFRGGRSKLFKTAKESVHRALVINRSKWDSLPSHLKAIISTAASWLNYQDNIRMVDAAEALETLVKEHGIQLKQFPDSVLKELARISYEIMRERASQDKLSQAVFESIMEFKQKISAWAKVSLQPFLEARSSL